MPCAIAVRTVHDNYYDTSKGTLFACPLLHLICIFHPVATHLCTCCSKQACSRSQYIYRINTYALIMLLVQPFKKFAAALYSSVVFVSASHVNRVISMYSYFNYGSISQIIFSDGCPSS